MPKVILHARFRQVFRRVPPSYAGFRRATPGSAGLLCRVPPGSYRVPLPGSAGFRWVPPLRRVPLGSARFRWVPGFRQVSSAGLCRVSANKVPPADSPFNLLLRLCQVLARRLPRLRQSMKRFLQLPGHCPSQFMERITASDALPYDLPAQMPRLFAPTELTTGSAAKFAGHKTKEIGFLELCRPFCQWFYHPFSHSFGSVWPKK